jgi:hypothetical protein
MVGKTQEPPAFTFSDPIRNTKKNHVVTRQAFKQLPSRGADRIGLASEAALHESKAILVNSSAFAVKLLA